MDFKEIEDAYQQAMLGQDRPSAIICGSLGSGCVITKNNPPCPDCPLLKQFSAEKKAP